MIVKSIANDTFGRLDWDPLLERWLGGIDWPPGLHTEVAIWPSDRGQAVSLRRARENLDWLQGHQEHARLSVAQAALTFYNDAWRGEGGPLTADALACRIELVRIGFEAEGSLLLSYGAGDLFGGHMIDGQFDAAHSLRKANLVG